jgi:adenosylmethionine-8-amino-7-oxononanoate aminotransferase
VAVYSRGVAATEPSNLFYQARSRRPTIARADGIYIWDTDGRRIIDGSSGAMVVNIGHGNTHVLQRMRDQMADATFAYRLHFENTAAEQLAADVARRMPAGLDKVFFVSGGSEAVESCIKLARQYAIANGEPTRYKVISRFPSYHGSTLGALALTGYDPLTAPFEPMMHAMPKVAAPTAYLDRDELTTAERGLRYADMLATEIEAQGSETVLAFIMEPVGGASTGALVAPDSYYARIREICSRYGVLLIYDEVMTGAGRTGAFLAAEHWGITPDLIALSKGFASGYCPLGAMVAPSWMTDVVLDTGGFQHGHTYAGNPLACAAGLGVMEVIDELGLIDNAATVGEHLRLELGVLADRYPFIGDVRGKGLLLACEVVADRATMVPLPPECNAYLRVVDLAADRGLIIYSRRTRGGTAGDHFLVCPPMITTVEQVGEIVDILDDTLTALAAELSLPVLSQHA